MKIIFSLYFLILGLSSFSQYEFENDLFEFSNIDSMCYRKNNIGECQTFIHSYKDGKAVSKELYSRDIISKDGLIKYCLTYKNGDNTTQDTTYIRYNSSKKINAIEYNSKTVCQRYRDTYEYNKAGQLQRIDFFSYKQKAVNNLDSSLYVFYNNGKPQYMIKKSGDTLYSINYANNSLVLKSISESLIVKYVNGVEIYRKEDQNITTTKYNRYNKPTIKETFDQNGNLIESLVFKYNKHNLIKCLSLINIDGQIIHKQKYKYK